MLGLKPAELVKWRKGLKLSQAEAATLLGKSRASVQLYEQGRASIPGEVEDIVRGKAKAPEVEAPPAPKPKGKAKAGEVEGTPRALAEAMKREPLYAETSAEAFAMRDELHRRALVKDKEAMRSCMPLIPLKPRWQVVQPLTNFTKRPMGEPFKVNAAIPDPVAWARGFGPRAVRTATGAVFDYETADQMRAAPAS